MRFWDLHCHLRPEPGRGRDVAAQADFIIERGRRVGIERFNLFAEFQDESISTDLVEALRRHSDRFSAFVWLDLNQGTQHNIDAIKRWILDGPAIGIKLGGESGVCSKPEFDPIFAHAASHKLPIYIHTWIKLGGDPPHPGGGNLPGEPTPTDVAILSRRYPDWTLICGHSGGDWELGVRAIRDCPNVILEVGGGFPEAGQTELAVAELGADRVIYGSDIPGRAFGSQVGRVLGADLPDADKEKIAWHNIARLLAPALAAKGITVA